MKVLLQNIWLRIFVVFVIVMAGYVFMVLLPQLKERARQQLPQKPLVEYRTAINQNYIAYQTLATYPGGTNLDASTLYSAESSLQSSLKILLEQSKAAPVQVNDQLAAQVEDAASKESDLISQYNGRYNALRKPLEYIPEADIVLGDREQAATRARNAHDALSRLVSNPSLQLANATNNPTQQLITPLSGTFSLDSETQQVLQGPATCFDNLANILTKGSEDATRTLKRCSLEYNKTYQELTQTITEPLRSPSGKAVTKTLAEALKQLDKLLNY